MDKMRKCPRCGTVQSAGRSVCVDCGSVLHGVVSDADAAKYSRETSEHIEELNSDKYVFRVPLWAKIVAGLDAALLVAFFLIYQLTDWLAGGRYVIIVPFLVIPSFIVLAFPRFNWMLNSRRSRWLYEEQDLTPSSSYLSVSRIFAAAMFAAALFVLIGAIIGHAAAPAESAAIRVPVR